MCTEEQYQKEDKEQTQTSIGKTTKREAGSVSKFAPFKCPPNPCKSITSKNFALKEKGERATGTRNTTRANAYFKCLTLKIIADISRAYRKNVQQKIGYFNCITMCCRQGRAF